MSDTRPDYNDDLPWLEPVDSEEEPRPVSGRKMLFALVIVLLAAAIVSGTFFWLGRQQAAETVGTPELIRAEPAPYKVKPTDPGGLDVAGESETAFQTSAGQDTDAQLNVSALPEQPKAEPKEEPKPAAANPPKADVEPAPKPTGAPGSVVQLGAYKNAAQAERAWTVLSTRFQSLGGTTKMVVPFAGGYRLRASASSPAEARQVCQAIRAGGENCFVAN